MVNVATERGWIPIQRNRSCDLRGPLILEAHDWRPVARTYARRKVAVAGLVGAWLSRGDYAAGREPGEPRGRNLGGGTSGTGRTNRPARAEGEKRLRSATRNP